MYRQFSLLLILCLIILNCSMDTPGKKSKNKKDKDEKRVSNNPFKLDDYDIYQYDADDNLIKEINYEKWDGAYRKTIKEYYTSGKLIKESYYDETGKFRWYRIYDYNDTNNIIKESAYNKEGEIFEYYSFEYNIDNKLSKRSYYLYFLNDPKPYFQFYKLYEYYNNSNKEKIYNYSCDDELWTYLIRDYDNNGNLILEDSYSNLETLNTLVSHATLAYDDNNNRINLYEYDEDGSLSHFYLYEYNEHNDMIKISGWSSWYNEKWSCNLEYIYDNNNNKLKELQYDRSGKLSSYIIYDYDDRKNLIKKSCYEKQDPENVKEKHKFRQINLKTGHYKKFHFNKTDEIWGNYNKLKHN